jgi:hypothetical protein
VHQVPSCAIRTVRSPCFAATTLRVGSGGRLDSAAFAWAGEFPPGGGAPTRIGNGVQEDSELTTRRKPSTQRADSMVASAWSAFCRPSPCEHAEPAGIKMPDWEDGRKDYRSNGRLCRDYTAGPVLGGAVAPPASCYTPPSATRMRALRSGRKLRRSKGAVSFMMGWTPLAREQILCGYPTPIRYPSERSHP